MTIEKTLQERGTRYGDFSDHARICQSLKDTMTEQPGWGRLEPVHKQALDVIADKIARILSGDPNYADNWHDIQGYAKLVEDRLPGAKPVEAPNKTEPKSECSCPSCMFKRMMDTGQLEIEIFRR